MPHLRFRALSLSQLTAISDGLVADFCVLTGAKASSVTLELCQSQYVGHSLPYVELHCFARDRALQDAMAALITRHVKQQLGDGADVVVQVITIPPTHYYRNGQHF